MQGKAVSFRSRSKDSKFTRFPGSPVSVTVTTITRNSEEDNLLQPRDRVLCF
jgi:hypothetical protein